MYGQLSQIHRFRNLAHVQSIKVSSLNCLLVNMSGVKRGKVLHSQARELVLNVSKLCEQEAEGGDVPRIPLKIWLQRSADSLRVSRRVHAIYAQEEIPTLDKPLPDIKGVLPRWNIFFLCHDFHIFNLPCLSCGISVCMM